MPTVNHHYYQINSTVGFNSGELYPVHPSGACEKDSHVFGTRSCRMEMHHLMPVGGYLAASVVLFFIGFIGFFSNLIVIVMMCREKQLWTPLNVILFNLVASDFSVSVLGNPFTLASAINMNWPFGHTLCIAYGFFMSLLGNCSVNWETRSYSAASYIVFLFAFGFFLPVIIISFSYINIITTMKKNMMTVGRVKAEARVAGMVAVMIAAFFFAWTPYAVLALLIAFLDVQLSPGLAVVPALVAKSSICYNPIIYVGLNTQFRAAWKRLLRIPVEGETSVELATTAVSASASPRTQALLKFGQEALLLSSSPQETVKSATKVTFIFTSHPPSETNL